MDMADEKRRMQENDLLKRERSLRRSRHAAFVLAVMIPVMSLFATAFNAGFQQRDFELFTMLSLLLAAVGYQYHLQIRHVESIKMYRRKVDDLRQRLKEV
jgi:hypothetical protein